MFPRLSNAEFHVELLVYAELKSKSHFKMVKMLDMSHLNMELDILTMWILIISSEGVIIFLLVFVNKTLFILYHNI